MKSDARRSRKLLARRIGQTPPARGRNEFVWFIRAFFGALVVVAALIVYVDLLTVRR